MKKSLFGIVSIFCLLLDMAGAERIPSLETRTDPGTVNMQRLHVYCRCYNNWHDGRITNEAEVELRDNTSYGPILKNAIVKVNGHELDFADNENIYKGSIGEIQQWQRIPIQIETQDGRKVTGYVAVVFMVFFREPKPLAQMPSSHMLPVRWDYSEGSMHTVELLILKKGEELKSLEVPGNEITLNFKRLGLSLTVGDTFQLMVLPFWTDNHELHGDLTKSSRAQLLSRASVTIRY
jgi:hypothetical protein